MDTILDGELVIDVNPESKTVYINVFYPNIQVPPFMVPIGNSSVPSLRLSRVQW